MALTIDYRDYLRLLPCLKEAPQGNVWLSCTSPDFRCCRRIQLEWLLTGID